MALTDELKKVLFDARSIAGRLGFRTHTVSLVVAETSGDYTGDGTRTETVTPITERDGYPPKVRWLKDDERALGQLPDGSVEIGPITPEFSGGGTSLATITGSSVTTGQIRLLRITGPQHPSGADYRVLTTTLDRALRYMFKAAPVGSQV